jgi:glycosyltransferase involved in cell wall biosynthesis
MTQRLVLSDSRATHHSPKRPQCTPPPIDAERARVSVVVPVYNEARSIAGTLRSIVEQSFPSERMEIIVVNGASTDGVRPVLEDWARRTPYLQVLENPRRTTPTSLNLGIAASDAEVIVRVDGHCRIAPDYVERCVELLASSGAANVGGPMRSEGAGPMGEAIAAATSSRFGIGNARFHYLAHQDWVDTVYLGAFRREVLEEVGGYDEDLVRNQDDELNYRIRNAGYGILLSPDIISTYTPRGSLRALWRQYEQYGFWKVRVIEKHPASAQLRHLAPAALVLSLLSSTFGFVLSRRRLLLLPWAIYVAGILGASALNARWSLRRAALLAAVFPALHLSYGVGFLCAAVSLVRRRVRDHIVQ